MSRIRGNVRAITTPHQTPTGGLRRSRSALALVLHRLFAVTVCLLKGQEQTGRVRGQTWHVTKYERDSNCPARWAAGE